MSKREMRWKNIWVDWLMLRWGRLKKTKSEMQNKIYLSLEDKFFTSTFKKAQEAKVLRRLLKRASPKFWVQNKFKKRWELGENQRLVQELPNEDMEYFFK